jgi:hypothetical protein
MSPRTAWVLRRLLCGRPLDGELATLNDPFHSVAITLAALPTEERHGRWNAFLDERPDRESIVQALSAVEPDAAQPVAERDDEEDEQGWGRIRLGELPAVPPFPLRVLPEGASKLAISASHSICCPVDLVAVAMLAGASGIIGQSVRLLVKPGYFVSASMYAALVGGPSLGKSPAVGVALGPVRSISEALHAQWKSKLEVWEATDKKERGERPGLQRIMTTDPTTEALGPILADNPRGIIVTPDEMTKWIMSMDQYKGGKGGDRPFYLSAWGGEVVYVDRAKHMKEPIVVPRPFLTVIGGMTPDMLSALPEGKGREDGFLARLLFSFPDRIPRRYEANGIPQVHLDEWRSVGNALWGRQLREDEDKPASHIIKLSQEAKAEWATWCAEHYREQEADDFPESLEGPWGKLESYAARLALVLHLLDLASDPLRPQNELPDVPRAIIRDAAMLIAYFKAHARRVYAAMGGKCDEGGQDVKVLRRWLTRGHREQFSERDISRNVRWFRDEPEKLAAALAWMVKQNQVRPLPDRQNSPKGGRPASPTFEVNPQLWSAPQNRQN